jgi:hypothetical protein
VPYKIQADPDHPGKKRVVNTETGQVHGSGQDAKTALSQFRLLEGIDNGWKPTGKPANDDKPRKHYGNSS